MLGGWLRSDGRVSMMSIRKTCRWMAFKEKIIGIGSINQREAAKYFTKRCVCRVLLPRAPVQKDWHGDYRRRYAVAMNAKILESVQGAFSLMEIIDSILEPPDDGSSSFPAHA